MNTIAAQIRELQTLPPAQLAERYSALFGKAPRVRNKAWLLRQVAWKVQESELGGLNDRARSRLDELIAAIDLPLATTAPRPKPTPTRTDSNTPIVGTTLVREWRGQRIEVQVVDGGFQWNGVVYRSLSAVAKTITGAGWSGALFFNLRKRRPAS